MANVGLPSSSPSSSSSAAPSSSSLFFCALLGGPFLPGQEELRLQATLSTVEQQRNVTGLQGGRLVTRAGLQDCFHQPAVRPVAQGGTSRVGLSELLS